jgi:hypothetical protein
LPTLAAPHRRLSRPGPRYIVAFSVAFLYKTVCVNTEARPTICSLLFGISLFVFFLIFFGAIWLNFSERVVASYRLILLWFWISRFRNETNGKSKSGWVGSTAASQADNSEFLF